MNEQKLKERVIAGDHNPTLEDLFEQGYELKCFCGKHIKSLEEFVNHDETMANYYQMKLKRV